jgi:hypothetical protein
MQSAHQPVGLEPFVGNPRQPISLGLSAAPCIRSQQPVVSVQFAPVIDAAILNQSPKACFARCRQRLRLVKRVVAVGSAPTNFA